MGYSSLQSAMAELEKRQKRGVDYKIMVTRQTRKKVMMLTPEGLNQFCCHVRHEKSQKFCVRFLDLCQIVDDEICETFNIY